MRSGPGATCAGAALPLMLPYRFPVDGASALRAVT